jgi:glycosyltransferase involved in cell wall biosynthesis
LSSYTENFGVAVIEALAAGIPTIVSTEVNLADAMREGEAGMVVRPDAAEFGVALLDLLQDKTLRAALAARGPAFAQRYDWTSVGPRLDGMYQRALALAR